MMLSCTLQPLRDTQVSTDSEPDSSIEVNYSRSTLGLYEVSTFDAYVDNQTIHVIVGGKQSAKDKFSVIRYMRSEDGGRLWGSPITIGEAFPKTIASRGNDIQLAVKGKHLVVLWQTHSELPAMGPIASAYSSDNGITWVQGINPANNDDSSQAFIDLIVDQQGHFHAVWLEDPLENGYQSLRYAQSIDSGKQWSQPVTLDDSTCSCCWNSFALSPKNELNVLYRDMAPRDMSLIQSPDGGMNWKKTSTVGDFQWKFNGCPHIGGNLTYSNTADSIQLHSLVWTGIPEKAGLYHLASNDNGQNWSEPKKLGNAAVHGDVAAHDRDQLTAIWNEMEAEGLSIFYTRSINGGTTWLVPKRLTAARHAATHPRLITTSQGVMAMWTEQPSKQVSRLAWKFLE